MAEELKFRFATESDVPWLAKMNQELILDYVGNGKSIKDILNPYLLSRKKDSRVFITEKNT
jgi:hypothetical protein